MPEIGNGLLCLALGIALLLSVYPLWGVARGDARMMASSRLFAWLLFMSVAGAFLAPVGNLDSYIRAANAWPMLSADEERALAEKLHYHGDLEAAKTLILSHLRFVVHIARNYAGYGLPQAQGRESLNQPIYPAQYGP